MKRNNPFSNKHMAQIASAIAIVVGCLVLLGWSWDIAFLKSIIPKAATMKANTAIGFILAGISLGLQTRQRQTVLITRLARGCAIAVLLIGLLNLCQYLFNWNLGIDELLFQDVPISSETRYPGRMGDNTALNIALTGLALWLNGQRTRRSYYVAQTATFITAAVALLALVGYLFNVQVFHRFIFYSTSMAVHTALVFLLLCVGILALQSNHAWMEIVTSNSLGGIVARQLLPAALAMPVILGWLIRQGQLAGWYEPNFGLSLMVMSLVIVLLALIGRSAAIINKIDNDRKRSVERLRSSEKRLQLALTAANQGIWDWNLKTKVLTWDDRCKKIFGLPADVPASYKWYFNALHSDDRERVFEAVAIALDNHTEFDQEYRTFHPDGTMRWIRARGSGYYDESGKPERMLGTVLDISDRQAALRDRQKAEADLKESKAHIQILSETARDLLSTQQPLALVETLFAQLKPLIGLDIYFNYIVDEQQQKLHLMFHGGITEETAREIEWLKFGQGLCGTVAQQRCQIVQPNLQQSTDPTTKFVRSLGLTAYSCQPLISQSKLYGTLGFGSLTRTEFTPAEIQLFQAICDRLAVALERSELLSSLQQQTEELKQTNRLKDEFLAVLSHELRTPLNPIQGWTQLLQGGSLTSTKAAEALTIIERNVKHEIGLVDDLLDLSRVVQGKFKLIPQPLDLEAILNASINTVNLAAIAKSITLESHFPSPPIGKVTGDQNRLQQVFWHLLANAIKFTNDGGKVSICLEEVDNNLQVSITDTGIGISSEFLAHVFDRFRQADSSSTRRYGGLGLGLALVKYLVELHGGTVTAESPGVGCGTTFKVKLPLLKEQLTNVQPESDSILETDSSLSLGLGSLTGIRIILIDDEHDHLDLFDFILTEAGASVTPLTRASEVLEIISANPPDLLISDLAMSEMNGYELLKQVRILTDNLNKPFPIIAVTAFAQSEDRERALTAGFQAYLSKPINPTELIETIESITAIAK